MKLIFFFKLIICLTSQSFAVDYFSFFGDAMKGVGSGNYISETHHFSNLHFISGSFENGVTNEWREKVLEASQKKNKSILMLEGFLFEWQSTRVNSHHHELLSSLKSSLAGLEGSIEAIYLIDEPYFKNSLSGSPMLHQEVFANLQKAARVVKIYFPNAKIVITEAYPLIDSKIEIPSEIDWVGINCYLAFGDVCSIDKIKDYLAIIASKLMVHQRFVFTLDGYWNEASGLNIDTQDLIIKRNEELMELAKQYNAVAFFPFLYQSNLTGEQLLGSKSMPKVLDYLSKIGLEIKNATFRYPTQCVVKEPQCELRDYVRRDSCGKEIERWINAPFPYCPLEASVPSTCLAMEPKCEGKDYVRRDSCGKEIERWVNAPAPYCPLVDQVTPMPDPLKCVDIEPKCEGKDYVRRDSCGKEIERWKNAPSPYCD